MGFKDNIQKTWNNPFTFTPPKIVQNACKTLTFFIDPRQKLGPDKVIPPSILANAKGLAVITVAKFGFVGSGRGGNGVVVARLGDGSWSPPSFITTLGAGIGGQIGLEVAEFVYILNDASAVKSFKQAGQLTLGGNVSCAAGPLGKSAEAAGTASLKSVSGIFSYSSTRGLFAGVSLEMGGFIALSDLNKKVYGPSATADQILSGHTDGSMPPFAAPLMTILKSKVFSTGTSAGDSEYYNDIPVYADDSTPETSASNSPMGARQDSTSASDNTYPIRNYGEDQKPPVRTNSWQTSATTNRTNQSVSFDNLDSKPRVNTSSLSKPSISGLSATKSPPPPIPMGLKPKIGSTSALSPPALGRDQVRAKFTFDADQPGDLSFKKGDIITIIKKTNNETDWWTGRIGLREGVFPSNYIEKPTI